MWESPLFATIAEPSPDGWYLPQSTAVLPVLTKDVEIIVGANTMDTLMAPPYVGTSPQLPDLTPKTSDAFHKRLRDYFGADIFNIYHPLAPSASADAVSAAFYGISGDVCNTCPKHWAAQKFLAAQETVYVYEFGFSTAPINGFACHGCEISDVFNISDMSQTKEMQASYAPQLGDAMARYWANFIKVGAPGGAPFWGKYEGDIRSATQLRVATASNGKPLLSVERGLDADKCDFFYKFVRASEANNMKYMNFCNSPVPMSAEHEHVAILV